MDALFADMNMRDERGERSESQLLDEILSGGGGSENSFTYQWQHTFGSLQRKHKRVRAG